MDEHFLILINKVIYNQVKNNLYISLEQVPLFENFNSFTKSIMNKEHLINFILILAVTFLSKKISYSQEKQNYLKILKDNVNLNTHLAVKNDCKFIDKLVLCQSLKMLIEKFDNPISSTLKKTSYSFKETIINHMDSAITNVVMFSFLFILFFSIALSAILLTLDVISI